MVTRGDGQGWVRGSSQGLMLHGFSFTHSVHKLHDAPQAEGEWVGG